MQQPQPGSLTSSQPRGLGGHMERAFSSQGSQCTKEPRPWAGPAQAANSSRTAVSTIFPLPWGGVGERECRERGAGREPEKFKKKVWQVEQVPFPRRLQNAGRVGGLGCLQASPSYRD